VLVLASKTEQRKPLHLKHTNKKRPWNISDWAHKPLLSSPVSLHSNPIYGVPICSLPVVIISEIRAASPTIQPYSYIINVKNYTDSNLCDNKSTAKPSITRPSGCDLKLRPLTPKAIPSMVHTRTIYVYKVWKISVLKTQISLSSGNQQRWQTMLYNISVTILSQHSQTLRASLSADCGSENTTYLSFIETRDNLVIIGEHIAQPICVVYELFFLEKSHNNNRSLVTLLMTQNQLCMLFNSMESIDLNQYKSVQFR